MAQVVVEMSGDEAKLFRAYQRIIDQASKLDNANKQVKSSASSAGQEVERTFGGRAAASLQSYITGMATLSTAARIFGAAMQQARADTQAAMQAVDGLVDSRRRLLQVSMGPGGQMNQQLNTQAEQLAGLGVPRGAARDILFGAMSEGFAGHEQDVTRLVASNLLSPESARRAAGQIPNIYKGAISPMQGVAGVVESARLSRLDVDQFMERFPQLASGAQIAGTAPAESMAIASVLAARGDMASRYLSTYAASLGIKKQFAGLGIMGMTEKLQGMPEAARAKALGNDKMSNIAYMWLTSDMAEIRSREKQIGGAMSDVSGYVTEREGIAFDPSTYEGRLNQSRVNLIKERNSAEYGAEQRLAVGGYTRQAAMTRVGEDLASRGVNPISRWGARNAMEWADTMRATPEMTELAGRIGGGDFNAWRGTDALMESARALKDAALSLIHASDQDRQRASAGAQPE
jgi:hypothetical protein